MSLKRSQVAANKRIWAGSLIVIMLLFGFVGIHYLFGSKAAGGLPGDVNGDGSVNSTDLQIMASHWGTTSGATFGQGDLNGDGAVSAADLGILASDWGQTSTGGGPTVPFKDPSNTDSLPTNLVFDDEFDGNSLNTANWSTGWLGSGITSPVQKQETECYDPAQVSVTGGSLVLSVIAKSETCGTYCITPPNYSDCAVRARPQASGAVNSSGKKTFTHGYFEARIWLDANGQVYNWPAWWLDGSNWPQDGEMDIMEGLGGNPGSHWHGPVNGGNGFSFGGGTVTTSGWHVFAGYWHNGTVTGYYDGKKVGSYTDPNNVGSAPQFLNLNEQMSPQGTYGGPVKVPSHMDIDYVRIWQ